MIVIVGAGPAGIGAAQSARECGAEVIVVDDNASPGGQIWRGESRTLPDGVRFVSCARVVSGDATAKTLLIETAEGAREIAYTKLILATGSRELFLPFPGWTLPGIFGVGALLFREVRIQFTESGYVFLLFRCSCHRGPSR